MKTIHRMLAASAVVLFGFVLYACGGSSSTAGGTLTQAQFDQMLAASSLFQALQSRSTPAVYIKAPNAKAYAIRALSARTEAINTGNSLPQTITPCTGIGTLTGRPTTSDAISASVYSGVSCTLYYFDISAAPTASDQGLIQQIGNSGNAVVYFDAAGCTGNAIVPGGLSGFSPAAVPNGAVFTMNPQSPNMGGNDWNNPANYWYVKAGSARIATINFVSEWVRSVGCQANSGTDFGGYAVLPNDPTVTGIQSAPVAGPVLISN